MTWKNLFGFVAALHFDLYLKRGKLGWEINFRSQFHCWTWTILEDCEIIQQQNTVRSMEV